MLLFFKGQVAVSLVAGIFAVIIAAILTVHIGPIIDRIATISIIAVIGGYLLVVVIFLGYAIVRAPVNLDQNRTSEIAAKESRINSSQIKISELTGLLSKKHPHDVHKEAEVTKALAAMNTQQIAALTKLLDAGEMPRGHLQAMGLDADKMLNRNDFPPLLTYRSFRPGNGTVEMDRFYSINPNMVESLRNVIYSSR